ncbi:hypothetical protein IWQ61_010558, partial [Dispira simplex]
ALLYSLGVFSSASTDNTTTNNEVGMVEYSQPWITQLEVHSQVVHLGGVIQDLAQSTSEDQAAFELIEDLRKILLAFWASTRQELVTELVTRAGLYLMTLTERAV